MISVRLQYLEFFGIINNIKYISFVQLYLKSFDYVLAINSNTKNALTLCK